MHWLPRYQYHHITHLHFLEFPSMVFCSSFDSMYRSVFFYGGGREYTPVFESFCLVRCMHAWRWVVRGMVPEGG